MIDIQEGRHRLVKNLKKHGPIQVVILAEITDPFGSDDGTSIEFNMSIKKVVAL